jgi:hypothetical protein
VRDTLIADIRPRPGEHGAEDAETGLYVKKATREFETRPRADRVIAPGSMPSFMNMATASVVPEAVAQLQPLPWMRNRLMDNVVEST